MTSPAAAPRSWPREWGLVALGAVAAAVYFTAPLALQLDRIGRTNSRDGMFSIWNVAWVAHALLSSPDHLLDANIFQPRPRTLTYSEANLGAGVLGAPFYAVTGSGVAAHNGAVLLGFVLCGLVTYALARRLSGSPGAAAVAAILFSYCPFVFARTAHIQLLMIWVLPACQLGLHRFADRPSVLRAAGLGASLGMAALFCAYYGILAGLMVGTGILFYAVSRGYWRRWQYWAMSLGASLVAGAVVWPVFRFYLDLQDAGFSRGLDEAAVYSADWRAYFASSATAHDWMLQYLGHWNEVLFPGFLSLALGASGMWIGLRALRGQAGSSTTVLPLRETSALYAILALLAFWSSFGPDAGLYAWLYRLVPVFSFLRAPARFAIALSLALSVFAAIAVAHVVGKFRRPAWIIGGLLTLAVLDLQMPSPLVPVPPPNPVYAELAKLPRGQVVELPYFYRPEDYNRHAEYMFNSIYHWQPLINGYADFIPEDFKESALLIASFPNPEGFQLLYDRRARYAVFHLDGYNTENRQTLFRQLETFAPYLELLAQSGDARLYRIVAWPEFVTRRQAVGTAGRTEAP